MSGIVIAVLAWLVIIGGIKSIGRAAEKLAPLKVGLYLVGGLIVIVAHAGEMPAVLALIVREAFSAGSLVGGTAGVGMMVAMRYGVARGIYANEAGYGTAAVAYATARSREPLQQGLNAVMEVFIVSFVTSSISALTILVTGVWRSGLTSTAVVAEAFATTIPKGGLDRGRLRVPLRLHDADRMGVLRRAVPRVRLRPARDRALPLGLLHPHRVRRHREGGPRLGLGRPHERPADLPEPRRRDRAQRHRRGDAARPEAPAGAGRRRARRQRERLRRARDASLAVRRRVARGGGGARTARRCTSTAATRIVEAYRAYEAAFAPVPHRICYAVKANGAGAILRLFASLGAGADIVSGLELRAALRAGFPPDRIVFSGVGKTDEEIAAGLDAGIGEFNAESEDEIARLSALAAARGRRAALTLRVNPDIDARSHPYISTGLRDNKFGVDIAAAPGILAPRAEPAPGSRSWACSATSARRSAPWSRCAAGGGGPGRADPAPARRRLSRCARSTSAAASA